jgi:hypothetical protein
MNAIFSLSPSLSVSYYAEIPGWSIIAAQYIQNKTTAAQVLSYESGWVDDGTKRGSTIFTTFDANISKSVGLLG